MGIGTVSKILWHFTGGPLWDSAGNRQSLEPKPEIQAFNNLTSILDSRVLRVGSYREVIHIEERDEILPSKQVCCLADIPINHLGYHSKRYGRFAIGFKRTAAQEAKFNPVLYIPYPSFASVNILNLDMYLYASEPPERDYEKVKNGDDQKMNYIIQQYPKLDECVKNHLSLVKTFCKETEYDTVYSEREWRSTESFQFTFDNIVTCLAPKEYLPSLKSRFSDLQFLDWDEVVEN